MRRKAGVEMDDYVRQLVRSKKVNRALKLQGPEAALVGAIHLELHRREIREGPCVQHPELYAGYSQRTEKHLHHTWNRV